MLSTPWTELSGTAHPVVLGGMAQATAAGVVGEVSEAGGLGILGCSRMSPREIADAAAEIRRRTRKPFGLNLLLFRADGAALDAVLAARPAVLSTAWAFPDQDLAPVFARARAAGAKVLHMAATVAEARRAAEAGADAIAAQGTEGGGHVGLMGSMVLVPMAVRAVAPVPVLAAGGIATGAGLAAALALGAAGALLGTRFLATPEAPLPDALKRAILDSDGHDTLLTEIPDVAAGSVWPGAYSRVGRNRFVEEWTGREGELRARRGEVGERMRRAYAEGDRAQAPLFYGQDAGLIDALEPAGEIVARLVREAEEILARLSGREASPWK